MKQRCASSRLLLYRQILLLSLATALGCSGEDGNGDGGDDEPRVPDDVSMLDSAGVLVGPPTRGPEGLQFDTSEFRVERDLVLLLSFAYGPGDLVFGTDELAEESREVIAAFDYGSGLAREIYLAPTAGVFRDAPPIVLDGQRLYTSTLSTDTEEVRVIELDVETGATLTESVVPSPWGGCQAVAGGDYYFTWLDDFLVARDITTPGAVDGVTAIASAEEFCPAAGVGSVDGRLVVLDAPTELDPAVDTIALSAEEAGVRQSSPLASVPVSEVSLGTEGERNPVVAIADDGLYVLASDFVSISIWFVPYARRPSAPDGSGEPEAPTLVTEMSIPFFSPIVPFEGSVISFQRIHGFAVVDGVLAVPLRLLEEAGSQRFVWDTLVMLDPQANSVDLFSFGRLLDGFGMVRSPAQ
ncbi:MAG: hypothetical protein AAF997_05085 [Myxococcota bacterium]